MMLYHKYQRPLVLTKVSLSESDSDGCIIQWSKAELNQIATTFVYLEVETASAMELAETLTKSTKTGVVATHSPELLAALYRFEYGSFRLALRVLNSRDLEGLKRCPYDAVEIPASMASHDLIWRTHNSGKEVYVRIAGTGKRDRMRQLVGLIHEKVDILIPETFETLSQIKSLIQKASLQRPTNW